MTFKDFTRLELGNFVSFNKEGYKDKEYFIISNIGGQNPSIEVGYKHGIPLCTKKQFDDFEESDAHIYWNDDGTNIIKRHNREIGTITDLKKIR